LALLLVLAPEAVIACVEPPEPPEPPEDGEECGSGTWVGTQGGNVMVKVRGFVSFGVQPGTTCACGFQNVTGVNLASVQVVDSETGLPLPGFSFGSNPTTAGDMEDADEGDWAGFSATASQEIPQGRQVDLVFTGSVPPGTTFNQLKRRIESAGNVIAAGKANADGSLTGDVVICRPPIVDPLPPPLAAPVLTVSRIDMGSPHAVEVTAHDAEEGLKTLRVFDLENAAERVPAFARGTRGPISLTISMFDDDRPARLAIEACNLRSECALLRPEIIPLRLGARGVASRSLGGVSGRKTVIEVRNGDPGLRKLTLRLDGRKFSVRPLEPDQSLSVELPATPRAAVQTVEVLGRGAPDGEVMLVFSEPSVAAQGRGRGGS
jgi:hypothetical protein